jgi:hypothetical protein
VVVHADLAELVLDDGDALAVILGQNPIQQRGLARPQKAGQHGDGVGFVSLGCPKALVDSERILTQLRLDGYEHRRRATRTPTWWSSTPAASSTAPSEESLDAIGEALARTAA